MAGFTIFINRKTDDAQTAVKQRFVRFTPITGAHHRIAFFLQERSDQTQYRWIVVGDQHSALLVLIA